MGVDAHVWPEGADDGSLVLGGAGKLPLAAGTELLNNVVGGSEVLWALVEALATVGASRLLPEFSGGVGHELHYTKKAI